MSDIDATGTCGLDPAAQPLHNHEGFLHELDQLVPALPLATEQLDVSIIGDVLFNQNNTDPEGLAITLLNAVDGIYSDQVGVAINVSALELLQNNGTLTSTASQTLLNQLAALSRTGAVPNPGLVHLLTGRNLNGSTIGIAFLSVLCSQNFGVGLSEIRTGSMGLNVILIAHELGHNFGAPHDNQGGSACASVPAGFTMNPFINGASDTFSQCSLDQIAPEVAAASCLVALSIKAPTGLQAIGGDATVALDWADNSEPDVTGYTVYRAESSGGPYSALASVAVSAYRDDAVVNGTPYFYVVTAVDADGNKSAFSAEVRATPGEPQAVTIAVDGLESNTLTGGSGWLAPWRRKGTPRILTANPAAGQHYVRLRATNWLRRPLDLTGVSDARLRFQGRVKSFEGNDRAKVQVSTDGVTYTTVREFTATDSDNTWHTYDLDLAAFDGTPRLRVRFNAVANSTGDRWFVDAIEVVGVR